jgi:hypothetical protein
MLYKLPRALLQATNSTATSENLHTLKSLFESKLFIDCNNQREQF